MTASEFLTSVNDVLRGTDEDAPEIGSDDANLWLRTLNRKKNELYNDSKVLWDATWTIDSVGTVTASATPTYNLESTLIAPSDQAYIVDTNSQKVYLKIVRPKERPTTGRAVYIAGMNPKVLYFTNEIEATEDIVGGTLYLPGYYMPADIDIADGDEIVPLPDPYWGVLSVAAEIAFGDITYEDKAEGLNAKANALYSQMLRNNRRGTYDNPKKTPNNVYRIKSPEVR